MSESTRSRPPAHGYWQSLEELAGDDTFARRLEQEFGDQAITPLDEVSRRSVLQLMSASAALAGLAGCRWPSEEIVPFDRRPEGYQPGKIMRFATSLEVADVVRPVVVSSFDGRPIKIEGHPDHPSSAGATDALTQAAILDLYDRDRVRQPVHRADGIVRRSSWPEFEAALPRLVPADPSTRLAVLSRLHASPSLEQVAARLLARYPALRWFEHAAGRGSGEAGGLESLFGRPMAVRHDLRGARVIVDLDADLLVGHADAVRNARAFAAGRHPDAGSMNRLYAFEPLPSGTGAAADHRVPVAPSDVVGVLVALATRLVASGQLPRADALAGVEALSDPSEVGSNSLGSTFDATLDAAVSDLLAHPGAGVVALGERYPAAAHALVHRLNLALGSRDADPGRAGEHAPVTYRALPERLVPRGSLEESLEELTALLDAGQVDCLLVLGGNPVYDAPADLRFGDALAKAGSVVYLGPSENETSRGCTWHLPLAHDLESWGDHWDADGRLLAVQPLIEPLFGGRTPAELLSLLADDVARTSHAMARQTFEALAGGAAGSFVGGSSGGGSLEKAWRRHLFDGFSESEAVGGGADAAIEPVGSMDWDALAQVLAASSGSGTPIELDLRPDPKVHDGRYANNGWLQELPDAITKLTWGNAALLGPALADELGVEHEDIVRIETAAASAGTGSDAAAIELPVFVVPGMAKRTVSVALGYGRRAGRVGQDVGVDAYGLQTATARWRRAVTVTPTGAKGALASTQNHYAIDTRGREERERRIDRLVREGTLADYEHHPEFAQHMGLHHPPLTSLWTEREGEGHQWGMAIDLNSCIACNACVVACQAENNIPVVGKDEVARGREMHWIRIDRYFHGDPDEAGVAHQPMACAHCELAPCEQVCPVGATMHSTEGLNVMAYNRCVGTRYCANNCPYKVRRFNFFNYNKDIPEVEALGKNPEVTIRARGVMEKCSYCVQRIEHARIEAKNEGREMRDGDVVTACQQACPSQAITFGDLADPESEVSKRHADPRAYGVLADLNTKPRTVYLARIRNPHPDLSAPTSHHEPVEGSHAEPHAEPRGDAHEGGH